MKQNPIKREAIEHLYAYSAIKGALMSGEDEAAEREEIESAWAELLTYEPEIAELMEMTFHLRSGEGKRSGRMYVQARGCDKLHISDRTYYAWRNLAVNTVIYHYTTAQRKIIDTYLQQIF